MTLTARRLRKLLKYDPLTGVFMWLRPPWNHPRMLGKPAGCTTTGYVVIQIGDRKYKAARLAWLYITGRWPKHKMDHRNRKPLDNRFVNLREATDAQNGQNHSHSGRMLPVGVHHDPRRGSKHYQPRVRCNGRTHYFGYYATAAAAHRVYLQKRKELFGAFCPE